MGAMSGAGGRGARRGRKRAGYRPMAEINVTPFVDVVLVLLIVFMVSAPLLTAGVPVNLPDSEAKAIADSDNKPLEITVTNEGQVFIGETPIQDGNLLPMLRAMTDSNPEANIYIRGDRSISYGAVMKIIGTINGAGYRKVSLISEPSR